MPIDSKVSHRGGDLFQRKITKLAGGAVVDWDDRDVRVRIYSALEKANKKGAKTLERIAKRIVRERAYDTGALYSTIKAYPSKTNVMRAFGRKKVGYDWIIYAGGDKAPYVGHVELGRYFKDTETRVEAVPFMRTAAARTRKIMRKMVPYYIRKALV